MFLMIVRAMPVNAPCFVDEEFRSVIGLISKSEGGWVGEVWACGSSVHVWNSSVPSSYV